MPKPLTRPVQLHVWLSEAEAVLLRTLAERRGLSPTQYLRLLLHEAVVRVPEQR